MGLLKYTVAESNNLKLGQNGFDVVAEHDTNTQTPGQGSVWVALKCLAAVTPGSTAYSAQFVQLTALEDTVVDTSECDVTWLTATIPATFKIPAGATIYGQFASIELDSGSVIAYYL